MHFGISLQIMLNFFLVPFPCTCRSNHKFEPWLLAVSKLQNYSSRNQPKRSAKRPPVQHAATKSQLRNCAIFCDENPMRMGPRLVKKTAKKIESLLLLSPKKYISQAQHAAECGFPLILRLSEIQYVG